MQPVRKNDLVPLHITALTALGSGIGHLSNGMVVFVPFTAEGDEILCRILKVEKRHAYGKIEQMIAPSPARIHAGDCAVYGKCGGCVFRHLQYTEELRIKQQHVVDCMRRIAGVDIPCNPIVGCENPDGYRNKAQYPIARSNTGEVCIGYYAPHSHRVVAQSACALEPPVFARVRALVREWIEQNDVSVYDETTKKGLLRHLYIRMARATGELMVCLVCTGGKVPATADLLARLQTVEGLCSVMVNLQPKDTNVILGEREFCLFGQDFITDILCGVRVRLSAKSFYQVNPCQAEQLYTIAREAAGLTGSETLLDLYCGTGTIGLSMAGAVNTLMGVEIVPAAVEDARRNAEANGAENARFLCADAAEAAAKLRAENLLPDVVILDPPRKGCEPELIQTVAEMAPARVVYVSCDPATLARDVKVFTLQGYEPQFVTPVDMFPRTSHCECVCLLCKQRGEE